MSQFNEWSDKIDALNCERLLLRAWTFARKAKPYLQEKADADPFAARLLDDCEALIQNINDANSVSAICSICRKIYKFESQSDLIANSVNGNPVCEYCHDTRESDSREYPKEDEEDS